MLLCARPGEAAAQSARQLGAWDGLVLSPAGSLAPVARDPADAGSGAGELLLRYGRWRYDSDDAVHDNIGLTWSHALGFARARVEVTGAYQLVECPTCSAWEMGGIDLESTVWSHAFGSARGRPVDAGAGLRLSLGASQFLGSQATTTRSVALTVPVALALPVGTASSLSASIFPGVGYGRIASADLTESGFLPMIGAAVAWSITQRMGVDVGMQQVVIAGGPIQVGAAFSLKLGSLHAVRP